MTPACRVESMQLRTLADANVHNAANPHIRSACMSLVQVVVWNLYYGNTTAASRTVDHILSYMRSSPTWAYNGGSRSWGDAGNNAKYVAWCTIKFQVVWNTAQHVAWCDAMWSNSMWCGTPHSTLHGVMQYDQIPCGVEHRKVRCML